MNFRSFNRRPSTRSGTEHGGAYVEYALVLLVIVGAAVSSIAGVGQAASQSLNSCEYCAYVFDNTLHRAGRNPRFGGGSDETQHGSYSPTNGLDGGPGN